MSPQKQSSVSIIVDNPSFKRMKSMPIINGSLVSRESSTLSKAIALELATSADEVDDETIARLANENPLGDKVPLPDKKITQPPV